MQPGLNVSNYQRIYTCQWPNEARIEPALGCDYVSEAEEMSDINAIIFAFFFARGLNMKDIEEFLHWMTFCVVENQRMQLFEIATKQVALKTTRMLSFLVQNSELC